MGMRKVRNVEYMQAVIAGDVDRYREEGLSYAQIGKMYGMTGNGARVAYLSYVDGGRSRVISEKQMTFTPTPLQKLALCSPW